jgi:integrase
MIRKQIMRIENDLRTYLNEAAGTRFRISSVEPPRRLDVVQRTSLWNLLASRPCDDYLQRHRRHTGATRTLRASKNLRAVKEMLGHADIKTTMRYAHALIDDVAEAMSARVSDEATRRAAHDSRTKSRETPEQSSDGAPKLLNQKKT